MQRCLLSPYYSGTTLHKAAPGGLKGVIVLFLSFKGISTLLASVFSPTSPISEPAITSSRERNLSSRSSEVQFV